MSYEVLARKWRPQRFDEVVGQAHVTGTLSNAIASKRVAHAYVFVGPRGVGKTSIARIFAKALNCPKNKSADPCDACDACREIRDGRSLDVIEIDGASNNGVDEVRDLRDNCRYLPARGPFKIYIIDEVHMLSVSAFNALLKTLEEPPDHVKFFLATTEVQKIPATILSRCQRFDLRRISTPDISNHLAKLAKQEGIEVDADALLAIARGAEGGLRDAESALDQLIAFRGKKITEADVLSVFGLVSRRALDAIAGAVLTGDVPALLKQIGELDAAGKDLQRLAFELLEYFRNLLVAATGSLDEAAPEATEAQVVQFKELAQRTSFPRLMAVTDILLELQTQIRFALSRRTLVELALIRGARAARAVTLDDVLAQLAKARSGLGAGDAAAAAPAPIPPQPAAPRAMGKPAAPAPSTPPVATRPAAVDDERAALQRDWHAFVQEVKVHTPLASGYLMDAKPVALTSDRLVLGFDPEFASNIEKISIVRNLKALQQVMEARLGRQVSVEFRVLSASEASELPADSRPPRAAAAAAEVTPTAAPRSSRQKWIEDPAVKRALETFHGDVIDIRE